MWISNFTALVEALLSIVTGALLLLAYSRDHGEVWFNKLKDQT